MDDYSDDWLNSLTLDDVFNICSATTGIANGISDNATGNDPYNTYTPAGQTMGPSLPPGDEAIGGRTSGRGSASAGGMSSGPDEGGSLLDGLQEYVKGHKDAIGLGAGILGYWGKTISDNMDASQKADAAEVARQQKEQDKLDALALSKSKYDTDWERQQAAQEKQWAHDAAVAEQRQKDQLAIVAAQKAGSGAGASGGATRDPAEERARRVSASIIGMKAPTGIVNSNIFGNALNTLQRK